MLKLYRDEACTEEFTSEDPDVASGAVEENETFVDEKAIYLKSDDPNLTYENISIEKLSDEIAPGVILEYAPDVDGSAGGYSETYEPSDGAYTNAHKLWRRVTKENVAEPFKREDVKHRVKSDNYIA